jgi:hypothetical protein
MRRIITFLSLVLMVGSFAAAVRWPTPTGATLPRSDLRVSHTPAPSPTVESGYHKVPVAPVYTLTPKPSPTPQAATPTPTPSPTSSPTVTPKCKKTCDGSQMKPGDTCRVDCD